MSITQPSYYDLTSCKDVLDIARKFDLSGEVMLAIKYLVRCGKKPGEDVMADLKKALYCVGREIEERNRDEE